MTIHHGIPETEYHQRKLGVVSKSALDALDRSPAHYRQWLADPPEPTPAMRFGSAFHAALLEPSKYAARYAVAPDCDRRTKDGSATYAAWQAANVGKLALSASDLEDIAAMVASVRAHRFARPLLAGGNAEVTARWQDEETGLHCKARADYVLESKRTIVDVKTTANASHDEFRRSIANYRYHVQAALYLEGFRAAGAEVDRFVFIVVEKAPPYACAVYMLDEDSLREGHECVRENIREMAECVRTDRWPAYPESILTIDLPKWARRDA